MPCSTFYVDTFSGAGFHTDQGVDQFLSVFSDFVWFRRYTADGSVNNTGFIYFERNFTTFNVIYSNSYVIGNCSCFRVRHQVTGT